MVEYLPDDMIMEILIRLPVKSLIRFKCVCKSWNLQISSPLFANTHHHRSANAIPRHRNYNLLLLNPYDRSVHTSVVSFSAPTNPSRRHTFPVQLPYAARCISGSCHGILLLLTHYTHQAPLLLWNPCTGHSRTIPHLLKCLDIDAENFVPHSFGYDKIGDSYKVIATNGIWSSFETDVYVLSLDDGDSWKKIGGFSAKPPKDEGRYFNGKLYWLTTHYNSYGDLAGVIISLDLGTQEYEQMLPPLEPETDPLPHNDMDEWLEHHSLVLLQGRLSIVAECQRSFSHIWVMEEHHGNNNQCCWTELFVIPCLPSPPDFPQCSSVQRGLLLSDDREQIILQPNFHHKNLVVYDTKRPHFLRDLIIDGTHDFEGWIHYDTYEETLISP